MTTNKNPENNHEEEEDKKKKKRFKSREECLKWWTTAVAMSLFFTSFSILLFLIPFVIDPACASIRGDFVQSPVECRIISSRQVDGLNFRKFHKNLH